MRSYYLWPFASIHASTPIDGKISCAAYLRCHIPVAKYSNLCQLHLDGALAALKSMPARRNPFPQVLVPKQLSWHLPSETKHLEMLQLLRRLTRPENGSFTLLVDTEFHSLKGRAPSLFEICVKVMAWTGQSSTTRSSTKDLKWKRRTSLLTGTGYFAFTEAIKVKAAQIASLLFRSEMPCAQMECNRKHLHTTFCPGPPRTT
jgi:hypothetical protein